MNDSAIYYVYVYLDPRKPGKFVYDEHSFDYEPFYVGKGKGGRCYDHMLPSNLKNNGNKHKTNKISAILKESLSPIVVKVYEDISECDANNIEMMLIKLMGRADKNLGCLVNMTDGGEGQSGKIMSEQNRLAISKANKGKKLTPEHISKIVRSGEDHPLYGKHHSKETRDKIRQANKLYASSDAGKKELSKRSLDFDYTCVAPDGTVYDHIVCLSDFCKQHGFTTAAVCYSFKSGTRCVKGYKFARICTRESKRIRIS